MIRTLTLAAIAAALVAALVAAPAAAQSIRVPAAGKSPEQLHADIVKAARSVCRLATMGASFPNEEMNRCVKSTVTATVSQSGDPALAAVKTQRVAGR